MNNLIPATLPHETTDARVAGAAMRAGAGQPALRRQFGTLIFAFERDAARGGRTLDQLYGGQAAGPVPTPLVEAVAAFTAEEHRRARQGPTAAELPSYSR